MSNDPDSSQHRSERNEQRSQRRPYDSSEIEKLPRPTDSDPPYRSWWLDEDKTS